MESGVILEACVETLTQALLAEKKGANRIELCAQLSEDGLTPSNELIQQAVGQLSVPIRIMIRPRSGDFVYNDVEIDAMKASIEFAKNSDVEGVVFGLLNDDNELDIEKIQRLALISHPLNVTIHKAIDCTHSPLEELKKLRQIKEVSSVLTSGKEEMSVNGIELLKSMVDTAGHIQIIACGKITDLNIEELHDKIQAPAYHGKKIVGELAID